MKKSLLATAAVAALCSLAACTAQSQTPQVDSERGVIVVDDEDGRDGVFDRDADDNMRSGQQLPADFPVPVPDDYQVLAVGDAGNETSAVLRVPSGDEAYDYYRHTLVQEGFRVVDEGRDQSGYFEAELEFSNENLEGAMDFDDDMVEIEIERF